MVVGSGVLIRSVLTSSKKKKKHQKNHQQNQAVFLPYIHLYIENVVGHKLSRAEPTRALVVELITSLYSLHLEDG